MILIENEDSSEYKLLLAASEEIISVKSNENELIHTNLPIPVIPESIVSSNIETQKLKEEPKNIISLTSSADKHYIAVTTENKQLLIYKSDLSLVNNILLSRVSNKVCFTPDNDILVADRTGDVYLYKLHEKSKAELLLGHLSVILDLLITRDSKFIITCDRDEKIRISHFPNAYNIQAFCLGHAEFVSNMKLINDDKILISGSGDGTIRMWNYLEGKQLDIIDTGKIISQEEFEKFSKDLGAEKVETTALPVTNIQVHEENEHIIMAVALYSLTRLILYKITKKGLHYQFTHSINIDCSQFNFYFNTKLYILTDKLRIFNLDNSTAKNNTNSQINNINILLEKLNNLNVKSNYNDDIGILYKKHYDNVQEYMERKKLRLDMK